MQDVVVEDHAVQWIGKLNFLFVFMETEAPYAVTPIQTTESMRTVGRVRWEMAKEKFAVALRDNHWPGYAEKVLQIEASPWALDNMIREEVENA